jgi:hypothetical protein
MCCRASKNGGVASPNRRLKIAALLVASVLGLAAAFDLAQGRTVPPAALESHPTAPPSAERAVQLKGRILDVSGDPTALAHVRVMTQARVIAETVTDHAGRFSFESLASGRVRVEADHDPEGAVRSAEISISTVATELTLVLAAASIRGLVVDADDGHPVAGATLSTVGVPFTAPTATSDSAGSFRFAMVPFEANAIVAVATGYRASRVTLGPREDQPEPLLRIELRAGPPALGDVADFDGKPIHAEIVACEGQPIEARVQSAADGTFSLPPSVVGCDAFALHDEMASSDAVRIIEGRRTTLRMGAAGTIAGLAVDDRGAAVDSFSVGVESFIPLRGSSTPHGGASPFKAGAFRLERLVPGTYVLTASTAGRPPARSGPIVVRSGVVTDGVKIVITQGGIVMGRVEDDQRAPLAGVELDFDSVSAVAGSDAVATTDGSGRYRLEGAPTGLFTVRVHKPGYRLKLVSGLSVASGRTLTKDVALTPMDGGPGLELGGIGANLAPAGNGVALAAVLPGDPADRAGLHAGDQILRIDGEETAGLSVVDAIQRLRGEPGTIVGVSVDRAGETLDVVITRGALVH